MAKIFSKFLDRQREIEVRDDGGGVTVNEIVGRLKLPVVDDGL